MKISSLNEIPAHWLSEMNRLGIRPTDEFFFLVRVLHELDCSMETRNMAFTEALAAFEKAGNKFCADIIAAFDSVFTKRLHETRELFSLENGRLVVAMRSTIETAILPTKNVVVRCEKTVRIACIAVAISGIISISTCLIAWHLRSEPNSNTGQNAPATEKVPPSKEYTNLQDSTAIPEWLSKIQTHSVGNGYVAVRVRENAAFFEFTDLPGKWVRIEIGDPQPPAHH